MSDFLFGKISGGQPPSDVPQEPTTTADVNDDNTVTADESFADDLLAAQLKRRAEGEKETAKNRERAESVRRLSQWMKVHQANTFHFDRDDESRRKLTDHEAHVATQEAVETERASSDLHASSPIEQQEGLAARLMHELATLIKRLEAMEGINETLDAPSTHTELLEGHAARVLQLSAKIASLESQARAAFFLLLGGTFGVHLSKDPRLTFARLFNRITTWPARIPPGRRPKVEAEFDSFIAWVFTAPRCGYQKDDLLW